MVCDGRDDAAEFAAEVVELVRNDDKWRASAVMGSDYVAQHFSFAAMRAVFARDMDLIP